MKWEPILSVDSLFDDMQRKTLLLTEIPEDAFVLEDFNFIHNNNIEARVDFTSGVRNVITKEQVEIAKELSNKVTSVMKKIEHMCGGELVGLEFKVKSEESLNRKFRDFEDHQNNGKLSSKALKKASENTHDVLRFTMLFNPDSFVEKFFEAENIMKQHKMTFIRVKNTFGAKNTYKGVNTYVFTKDEQYNYIFELQFHTKESWVAKEVTHGYYEIERDTTYSKEERDKAHRKQQEIFGDVKSPNYFNLIKEVDRLSDYKVGVVG